MRIRLLTDRATETSMAHAGEIIDLPDSREAYRMIASGTAEPAETETMTQGPQRAAVLERPRLNRRGR